MKPRKLTAAGAIAICLGGLLIGCARTAVAPTATIPPTVTAAASEKSDQYGVELPVRSRPAVIGLTKPFTLYSHCGVDYSMDFAASYWDLDDPSWTTASGNPGRDIGNPYQDGTMTLVDADHARFDFPSGRIRFRRHVGPKIVAGLCA